MEIWERRLSDSAWMDGKDRELFLRFVEAAQSKRRPAGNRRIEKYLSDLGTANRITKRGVLGMAKTFKALTESVKAINADKTYSFDTKRDVKRLLGAVHQFITAKEPSIKYAPREVKELCAHDHKPSDKRLAKETITREEMRAMLAFGNTLDKALISLLYDSGMRIGELIQLRKSDLCPIKEGMDIRVPPGKTGERRIVVVEAAGYVQRWLEEHPDKGEDGPLWLSPETKRPLRGPAISKRIRLVVERMNATRKKKGIPPLRKPINVHNFRHSRATELGGESGMTEQILCKYFGWEIGSTMPRTYLHLTDEQVKKAVLRVYGKVKKEEEKVILTHRTCRRCQENNPIALNFCGKCGSPMDSDKEITRMGELEEQIKQLQADMRSLVSGSMKKNMAKRFKESVKKRG